MDTQKVIELVKKTKDIILDKKKASEIEVKGYGDFVTQVDFAVQGFLFKELSVLYPSIQCVGEESDNKNVDYEKSMWILDPIDGTANLVYGLNQSAVSLGLVEKGEPVFGVVYNPFSGELFWGEKGKGAYLHDKKLSVTKAEKMSDSLIGVGTSPYYKELADENFSEMCEVFKRCLDIRRFGAAALDLCNLAAGRIDGFYEKRLKPWDYTAGAVIVTEAGGKITNFNLGKIAFDRPDDIIATNSKIHSELADVLKNVKK